MAVRVLLLIALVEATHVFSQELPLVYEREHTGEEFPLPSLPSVGQLPVVRPLPDPFAWSDGTGRSTDFDDWVRRRAEIKAEIEHYEIGERPPRPEQISAKFARNHLTVTVEANGQSLTLKAHVRLPEGKGPFPAVIGVSRGSGSLPSDIFIKRNVAMIAFDFRQIMSHTQQRGAEPINRLYPELTSIGAYSAWPWGVSRLIDGLELVEDQLPIDRKHLGVTGCSFAGKLALFAGAFDERIALTIVQESGGGGAAAWRVSETLGHVETLSRTSRAWFRKDLFKFSNSVEKLPYDHHELMAMVAPRALLILGNPNFRWLATESEYVSCLAAHEVWKTFGIADRFGFSIVGEHPHCRLPESQRPEVEAFVDKFLLGEPEVSTVVARHSFEPAKHKFWYDGWGDGKSSFPSPKASHIVTIYHEAEAVERGSDWQLFTDADASDESYLEIESGLNSIEAAPEGEAGTLHFPLSITRGDDYHVYARVRCLNGNDDSFWVKIDDRKYAMVNGLQTTGWEWVKLLSCPLEKGDHSLTVAYREDGAQIDKVCVTSYIFGPRGFNATAD